MRFLSYGVKVTRFLLPMQTMLNLIISCIWTCVVFLSSSACYKNFLSYEEHLKKGTWMLMYKEKESHKNFA